MNGESIARLADFRSSVPEKVLWRSKNIQPTEGRFSAGIFAAAGYRCLAFDMPGCGKTGGLTVPDAEKAEVIPLIMRAFELDSVILVGHSMAGKYIVPMLGTSGIAGIVAIALSNTNELPSAVESIQTSLLVIWGERDTSLGPNAASNLSRLPKSRLVFDRFCRVSLEQ
ncbi:unnamed protein product [Gongylonema pulchrum]|uniref:AB hydrolase-1 domain-containing protein n=1 Tax=Gongylonema pulchrum TaxID=637853 RepID=A0A183EDI2_9BILA|nr:unnamed protein product [Gongylonema pulchrum]